MTSQRRASAYARTDPYTLRYKFEPEEVAVTLTAELPRHLRQLRTEGNIFKDRYICLLLLYACMCVCMHVLM